MDAIVIDESTNRYRLHIVREIKVTGLPLLNILRVSGGGRGESAKIHLRNQIQKILGATPYPEKSSKPLIRAVKSYSRGTLSIVPVFCLLASIAYAQPPAWSTFANNNVHTAAAPASPQPLTRFHWTAAVDLAPPVMGGALPIHYATPLITAANTVLVPVRTGAGNTFRIEAHSGLTGIKLWSAKSAYTPPPSDWVPPFPAALTPQNKLVSADAGGTVIMRANPDAASGATARRVFYGMANWKAFPDAYNAAVAINTPITADAAGNIFFGFTVSGATPINLISGLARLAADGSATWVSAAAVTQDPTAIGVAQNCAPALSADGSTLYVAVTNANGGALLALDATTLALKAQARLLDPVTGQPAVIDSDSTASPTVAPDGDVYFGVLESNDPQHDNRGWLLHFDSTLTQQKTPGSFGWDTTASMVPTAALSGYSGKSTYLLVTKYNNYFGVGLLGDGLNRVALLDPSQTQKDPYSTATVMRAVKTILQPVHKPGDPPHARYEWCINSAVVDARTGTVIANSEDGKLYAWDLSSNRLTQSFRLNAPRLEAYTPTVIGPDGTVYAINNSTLYAIGK